MNKKIFLFLMLVLVSVFAKESFAGFSSSISSKTYTASAVFTSAGEVSISLEFRNLAGGTTNQIWWNPSGISLGSTIWRRADSYIVLHSTLTLAAGAVQIYTDNKATDASPQYTGSANPAGMVSNEAPSADPLPMCWRVTDVSTNTLTIQYSAPYLYSAEIGSGFHCFLVMKDKNSIGFVNGEDYVTVKDQSRGFHYAVDDWALGAVSPDYIYIGADFTSAVSGRSYKTSALRIEAYME